MDHSPLDEFPAHAHQIKLASVAPDVTALFARLPRPVAVAVELPAEPAALPISGRQLLRLGLGRGPLVVASARLAADGVPRLRFTAGARALTLEERDLAEELRSLTRRLLAALYGPEDCVRALELFAREQASLATLQQIVSFMLQSTDVDEALYAMLSGITSGHGLGFNRAALFIHDAERGAFVGAKAIGPADAGEAHRIWEEIAYEDASLARLLEDYSADHFDSRLQQRVQQLTLTPGPGAADEVARALGPQPPLVFRCTTPENESLAAADLAAGEFVLAAIAPHGTTLGLVYADNLFSAAPITAEQRASLRFFLEQTALVWENLSLLRKVGELARTDSLTGVFNRREFELRYADEQSRAQRSGAPLGLLLIDIDRFKQVNDEAGHAAGDAVLKRLGVLLRQALRTHDVVGRFGGDEFVVLLPDTDRAQLAVAARRVGELARAAAISLSVGAAAWPADCPEPALLLPTADENLYRAKRAGRQRVCLSGADPIVIGET